MSLTERLRAREYKKLQRVFGSIEVGTDQRSDKHLFGDYWWLKADEDLTVLYWTDPRAEYVDDMQGLYYWRDSGSLMIRTTYDAHPIKLDMNNGDHRKASKFGFSVLRHAFMQPHDPQQPPEDLLIGTRL